MYEALTDYLPKIQDSDSWVRDTSCYIDYTSTVNEFRKEILTFMDNHPEYELNRYIDTLRTIGTEWGARGLQKVDVSDLDGKVIMALLMAAERGEYNSQGVILDLLESGTIQKWLLRLKELDN